MSIIDFIKRHAFALIVACIILILILLFHKVMAPFVIALILVYLMEPIVRWLSSKKIRKRAVPRWFCVISVYIAFFSASVGFSFLFVPSLSTEIGQATTALPEFFTRVKNEELPRWSAKIDKLMFKLRPENHELIKQSVHVTQEKLHTALQDAIQSQAQNTIPPIDLSGTKPILLLGQDRPDPPSTSNDSLDEANALLRLKQISSNEFLVLAANNDLLIESDSKGSYTLRLKNTATLETPPTEFNLEEELNRIIVDFLESSTKYAGSALTVLQYLLEFIINTFIQLILVFMLAAFISIDLPSIMNKLRSLFLNDEGNATKYDDLLEKFNRGLSGVIRGQLLICCINGTLTTIGLWIFGVDFALLLGIVAGILSIIPVFGTIISTIPCVLLGLVQGFSTALAVLIWILVVHFIDANILTPKIVGSSSHLHPVVIIFAILAGQTFGILGIILAVPTTSILQTILLFVRDQVRKAPPKNKALTE